MIEKPRTYNQILRYSRCLSLREYIPTLTDETIEELYNFLGDHYQNTVTLTEEMLTLVNPTGEIVKALPLGPTHLNFERLVIGSTTYQIYNAKYTSTDSGGCGCGGCSSNNNNNNNNNNG